MSIAAAERSEWKVLSLVGAAHFASHVYYLLLPPLFPLLKDEFDASYTELGLALAAYGLASSIGQTPVGFAVDRIGGRTLLALGLFVQGATAVAVAFVDAYWMIVVLFGVAGLANTVFHPADYAILSASIRPTRLGRAFSVHNLTGNIGSAVTAPAMIALTALWDWRAAIAFFGLLSIALAALLQWQRGALAEESAANGDGAAAGAAAPAIRGIALLLSGPILTAFAFCVLTSIGFGAIYTYVVAAVVAANKVPLVTANAVLTGFLAGSAAGIFIAGFLVDRVRSPDRLVIVSTALAAAALTVIGFAPHPVAFVLAAVAFVGCCSGVVQPARDLLIRQVTPAGTTGAVFGFLSTGFAIGGAVTPLVFGWILDRGEPHWLYWLAAAFFLGSVVAVSGIRRREPVVPAPAVR
jgi:predicted MFS family arabinose efflux permease